MKRGRPQKKPVLTCWDVEITDKPIGRSTIWDAKTRSKRTKKKGKVRDIRTEVDAGFRYFWSRRRTGQYHNGGAV